MSSHVDCERIPGCVTPPPVPRTQHAREQLQAAIERGDYGPGERLPSERELVELLGVSRVSVREATRSLQALGLVEVHHGRGCFVAPSPSDRYASSFSRWLLVHRDEVLELLKVRGALDELAAESAARRPDAHERCAHLRELNAIFAGSDADASVNADVAFHQAVAEASGVPLLVELLRDLHQALNESRRAVLASPARRRASAREHDAIVDAIERGDGEAARRAVADHIGSVRDHLSRAMPPEEIEQGA